MLGHNLNEWKNLGIQKKCLSSCDFSHPSPARTLPHSSVYTRELNSYVDWSSSAEVLTSFHRFMLCSPASPGLVWYRNCISPTNVHLLF